MTCRSFFPEPRKIMAILIGRIIHLYNPYLIGVSKQMLVILSIDGDCLRGYLIDISAVGIIMLSFLGVTEDLPSLHDELELLFTGVAIGIFIGVVFEDQFLVYALQLGVAYAARGLKHLVVVYLGVQSELGEANVNVFLVLEGSDEDQEDREVYQDFLGIAVAFLLLDLLLQLDCLLLLLLAFQGLLLFLFLELLLSLLFLLLFYSLFLFSLQSLFLQPLIQFLLLLWT